MMKEAETKLGEFIKFNQRPLLAHLGSVKREVADALAEREFEVFKEKRRAMRQAQ